MDLCSEINQLIEQLRIMKSAHPEGQARQEEVIKMKNITIRVTGAPWMGLSVPDSLILGKPIKAYVGKYILECTFDGKQCIFKYDTEDKNRFRIDLQLMELGIAPKILFPTKEDIVKEKYPYCIYVKLTTYDAFKGKTADGVFQDLVHILTRLREKGLLFIDFKKDNIGFNEKGQLMILDGVMDPSTKFEDTPFGKVSRAWATHKEATVLSKTVSQEAIDWYMTYLHDGLGVPSPYSLEEMMKIYKRE